MFANATKRVFLVLGLAVLVATSAVAAPEPPTLVSPARGAIEHGHVITFQWNGAPDAVSYRILVTDQGTGLPIQWDSGITGTSVSYLLYDSVYSWVCWATDAAGTESVASEEWLFTVSNVDTVVPDVTVTSPNGGDTGPPDCGVTSPNGGEVLDGGSDATITWYGIDDTTATGNLKVGVYFSADGGKGWSTIATSDHNGGSYRWRVPNISTDRALIRVIVTDLQFKKGGDNSDAVFSIQQDPSKPSDSWHSDGSGDMGTPWVHDALLGGSYFPITWYVLDDLTSTPDLKIIILFSYDGGDHFEEIVQLDHNPQAFFWHVPNIFTNHALVKVQAIDEEGNVGQDVSDFEFSIIQSTSSGPTPAGESMVLGAPNGGQVWKRGTAHTISWASTHAGGDVGIKLYKGRRALRTIARRTANDGTFRWKVPATLPKGSNYSVRISCLDYAPKLADGSDRFFVIK